LFIPVPGAAQGAKLMASIYGVPPWPKAWEGRSVRRRRFNLHREADGRVIRTPAGQMTLYGPHIKPQKCHHPSVTMTPPQCQNDTPPSGSIPLISKNHGAKRGVGSKKPGRQVPHISLGDLTDSRNLADWIQRAIDAGVEPDNEASRLRLAGAAVRAVRASNNPPRLLAWTIKHRAYDRITQADEDEAVSMLKIARGEGDVNPIAQRLAQSRSKDFQCRTPDRSWMTPDDKLVAACLVVSRKTGNKAYDVALTHRAGLSPTDWNLMMARYKSGQAEHEIPKGDMQ